MNSKYPYIFRIVLSGYLVYLGGRILYVMIEEKPVNMGAMSFLGALFIAIGGAYAVYSGKNLWKILKNEKEVSNLEATQEMPVMEIRASEHAVASASETALVKDMQTEAVENSEKQEKSSDQEKSAEPENITEPATGEER